MIPGRIRIAVLAVSAAMLLGRCTQLHHRERSREVIDIADKCTLSPEALVERIADVKASLGSRILERAELDDGIAIRFLTDSQTIQVLRRVVRRVCLLPARRCLRRWAFSFRCAFPT